VYDIVQAEDVLVLQLLHQGDLADGGTRRAFVKGEADLFESYELTGLPVPTFEDLFLSAPRS
jgi:hypothetical protein